MDIGGYLWLVIDVIFVAALAAAIVWATHQWRKRRRSRTGREAEEEAVERAYRED